MIQEVSFSVRMMYSRNLRTFTWDVTHETFPFQFTSVKFKG